MNAIVGSSAWPRSPARRLRASQTFTRWAFTRWAAVLSLLALAACQTPGDKPDGGWATPNPHYKVGTPYQVAGRWFYPKVDKQYDVIGVASWYGDEFHGKLTANGEVFDKRRMTAAHTTLPMPILVEVTNLENGRRTVLRVNDRGPFVGDRIIDLSHAAATYLGFDKKGLARVRVRYVGEADLYAQAPFGPKFGDAPVRPSLAKADDSTIEKLIVDDAVEPAPDRTRPREVWIDVASFTEFADLQKAAGTLKERAPVRVVTESRAGDGAPVYRLQMGPYFDAFAADARLAALREEGYAAARIVR